MAIPISLPPDYWSSFTVSKQDIEFLNTYLFEHEQPLAEKDLVPILVEERIKHERSTLLKKQQAGSVIYAPKEHYKKSDMLVFPAMAWKKGKVVNVRQGVNPALGEFEVIGVEFEDGTVREFASKIPDHKLNQPVEIAIDDPLLDAANVLKDHRAALEQKLGAALKKDSGLARIAGQWFPRSLMVDVNVGHLNLAEAVLDEMAGQPITTTALLEQIGMTDKVNPKLLEFSLNFSMQEDGRFDEVGPEGQVLWCLQRLEPLDVREIPKPLRYISINYDRGSLTKEMLALEQKLDDELSELPAPEHLPDEVTIVLSYPHWRAGTLPVSNRMEKIFPTAYESPRVRFSFIDAEANQEIPAWVVRDHGYVAGVGSFYKKHNLMPGSQIVIQRGKTADKVILKPKLRRPMRDWVRTVLVGRDGGIVFAMLKQNVNSDFDERTAIYVPDIESVDQAQEQLTKEHLPFEKIVANMMRELTKLNVQGHVHAMEIYSAINIIRRCPPGPLLAVLSSTRDYAHVGDLHFRLENASGGQE